MSETRKLQQTNYGQYVLYLPKHIVKAKGWKRGQELKITIGDKGELIIRD